MRLKVKGFTRKSQAKLKKSYNPINLDYIFHEDDHLDPWLEELEDSLLDVRHKNNQTYSWNGLNDDDDDNDGNKYEKGSSFQAPELGENPSIQYGVDLDSLATDEPHGLSHDSHLSVSNNHDDDDDNGGGGGGEKGGTCRYDNIRSYGQSSYIFHGDVNDQPTREHGRKDRGSTSGRYSACSRQRFHQFDQSAHQPLESIFPTTIHGKYGYFANLRDYRNTSSGSDREKDQGQNLYYDYQFSSNNDNYGNIRIPLGCPPNLYPNYYYHNLNQ